MAARGERAVQPSGHWLDHMRPRARVGATVGFVDGLRDVGLVEDPDFIIDYRSADESTTASWGSPPSSFRPSRSSRYPAAWRSPPRPGTPTSTIPILFMIGSDPVELGLVKNFSRPGVNLTGVAYFNIEVAAKRLELLHKLLPEAKSIALLVQRGNPLETQVQVRNAEAGRSSSACVYPSSKCRAERSR